MDFVVFDERLAERAGHRVDGRERVGQCLPEALVQVTVCGAHFVGERAAALLATLRQVHALEPAQVVAQRVQRTVAARGLLELGVWLAVRVHAEGLRELAHHHQLRDVEHAGDYLVDAVALTGEDAAVDASLGELVRIALVAVTPALAHTLEVLTQVFGQAHGKLQAARAQALFA